MIINISLLIYSCSNTNLYRVTITQGTVFAQEDVDKLEIGMTKDQVSFVMGQPSFENFFEKNVWNYMYKITTGDNVDMEKKVKLIFDEKNLLSEVVIIQILLLEKNSQDWIAVSYTHLTLPTSDLV